MFGHNGLPISDDEFGWLANAVKGNLPPELRPILQEHLGIGGRATSGPGHKPAEELDPDQNGDIYLAHVYHSEERPQLEQPERIGPDNFLRTDESA